MEMVGFVGEKLGMYVHIYNRENLIYGNICRSFFRNVQINIHIPPGKDR